MSNRIAIIGCKSTTQFLIENLNSHLKISYVVTIDALTAKKNEVADYTDLRDLSKLHHIKCYTAASYSLNTEEDFLFFKDNEIDLCFVMGWQRLIPEKILKILSIGAFGMHGSAMGLPFGRGRSPLNWAIIEGKKQFYTSLFKYDKGIDSGGVLDTYKFQINDLDNAETLHLKNSLSMLYLLKKNIDAILQRKINLIWQDENKTPTYYPKRTPSDSLIDWSLDINDLERFIRAVSYPFNGAFTFIESDRKVKILNAQVFDYSEFGYENANNGEILQLFPHEKILVKCSGGLLLITKYEADFVIKKGKVFCNGNLSVKVFEKNRHGNHDI